MMMWSTEAVTALTTEVTRDRLKLEQNKVKHLKAAQRFPSRYEL